MTTENQRSGRESGDFLDVRDFHEKFGIGALRQSPPAALPDGLARFRLGFLCEELAEYAEAVGAGELASLLVAASQRAKTCGLGRPADRDLAGAADALVDLVVVALGTADLHGFDWPAHWAEVHRANMSKARARADGSDSKRGSAYDVVKPAGWRGPDHEAVLSGRRRP